MKLLLAVLGTLAGIVIVLSGFGLAYVGIFGSGVQGKFVALLAGLVQIAGGGALVVWAAPYLRRAHRQRGATAPPT